MFSRDKKIIWIMDYNFKQVRHYKFCNIMGPSHVVYPPKNMTCAPQFNKKSTKSKDKKRGGGEKKEKV